MLYHRCLVCNSCVDTSEITEHNKEHPFFERYGTIWPALDTDTEKYDNLPLNKVNIYSSLALAQALEVSHVYIRNEGEQVSGSMKDYLVRRAVEMGVKDGFNIFTVVSSGNQAFSLAKYTQLAGVKALLFMPETSSKIPFLRDNANVRIVGIKNAIFEDVYNLCSGLDLPGVYNANVNNELLLPGFSSVSEDIVNLDPMPNGILAGVGNGSYLAGIAWGFDRLGLTPPQIIPVGMSGAFPTETALHQGLDVYEYPEFIFGEQSINAAEGSIAIASYSMPQLIKAVKMSNGFSLGGLTNDDLSDAYFLLYQDRKLLQAGVIPEPTGIMGLAAAMRYKNVFRPETVLMISFTGHGVKDPQGIRSLVPELADSIIDFADRSRPDLTCPAISLSNVDNVVIVDKDIKKDELKKIVCDLIND